MGDLQPSSSGVDPFKIPWLTQNIKFQYGKLPLYIEEITEPWDLWVESAYLQTSFGAQIGRASCRERV